jgi:hypothetical protein
MSTDFSLSESATGIAYFVVWVYPAWIPDMIIDAFGYTTLSVGTTTVSTIIIVTRILLVSSQMPGLSKKTHLAAEIVTESAILYTISALVYIGAIPSNYASSYTSVFFGYMAVR